MFLGQYQKGKSVWVPAIMEHPITGQEYNPAACTGYYQKVAGVPGGGTALTFNQFNAETGAYYAVIDTTALGVGMYAAFVEATVAGVSSNAIHHFEVVAAAITAVGAAAPTVGECVSVTELKSMIDPGSYTDGQLQYILDRVAGKLYEALGHSFGRALRIYHDETVNATAATVEVTDAAVILTITGGAKAGTYTYTFAVHTQIGSLVETIIEDDYGFQVELLEVIPYEQPTENLDVLAATSVFGFENRVTLMFDRWTECFSGANRKSIILPFKPRTMVSLTEDGVARTLNTDYYLREFSVVRAYCEGSNRNCWQAGYWSCVAPCNVVVRWVPRWWGMCPASLKNALIMMAGIEMEWQSDGTYKSERMGDYSYTKGDYAALISQAASGLGLYMKIVYIG